MILDVQFADVRRNDGVRPGNPIDNYVARPSSFEVIDGGGVYHSGRSEEAISQVVVRIAEEPRGGFEAFESTLRSIVPAHCLLDLQMMEGE